MIKEMTNPGKWIAANAELIKTIKLAQEGVGGEMAISIDAMISGLDGRLTQ